MRALFAGLCLIALAVAPGRVAADTFTQPDTRAGAFTHADAVLHWIYGYRARPEPWRLPEAVRAMHRLGLLSEEEKAGFFVGFTAGVLASRPGEAGALVQRMSAMPPKEQGAIIKAIAYSGLPEWRELLAEVAPRMPYRRALIDRFLAGEAETLMYVPLESGPTIVYTLWGYYYATGHYQPVTRIISALAWSAPSPERRPSAWRRLVDAFSRSGEPTLEQLTVGGTAKWTLAAHAERNRDLVALYRAERLGRGEEVVEPLDEVIVAADAFEAERIRKEQGDAIEEAKRQRALAEAAPSRVATVSSVAIATGCVIAGATGHAEIAVPCVVGGAVFSGVLRLMRKP